jgi:leader peptidase (prepilin peptidase)/N-methyltransferase
MHIESFAYALFGLIIGSFLNVCIYRIPLGKSIVFPGSSCTHCASPIRFYDNIPVLSFLLLRGKCRSCGNPISFQYPLVELLTALAFYFCARVWQFASPTFVNTLFLSIIIILVFTDYNHRILPNKLTLPGIVVGILLSPFQAHGVYTDVFSLPLRVNSLLGLGDIPSLLPWTGSLLGVIVGGGPLFLVALAYETIRRRQGLGMGDIKMMAMVGAFTGWQLALLTIFAGSLMGTIVGVFLMISRKMNMQGKLPFGVFLGAGSALSLFYGQAFLHWYLRIPQ